MFALREPLDLDPPALFVKQRGQTLAALSGGISVRQRGDFLRCKRQLSDKLGQHRQEFISSVTKLPPEPPISTQNIECRPGIGLHQCALEQRARCLLAEGILQCVLELLILGIDQHPLYACGIEERWIQRVYRAVATFNPLEGASTGRLRKGNDPEGHKWGSPLEIIR